MRRGLILSVLMAFSMNVCGEVTLDAKSAIAQAYGSSVTFAHTVGAEANYLTVQSGSTSGDFFVTVTFNGEGMSKLVEVIGGGTAREQCVGIFGLINPDSGTHNVVVTYDFNGYAGALASSWNGVDTDDPAGTGSGLFQADGSSISKDIESSSGQLVIDVVYVRVSPAPTLTPTGGQTLLDQGDVTYAFGTSYLVAGDPATTMSWSWSGSNWNSIAGVALKPMSESGRASSCAATSTGCCAVGVIE